MNATDLHQCEIYHCKMTVGACVARYLNATGSAYEVATYKAGCGDIGCRGCAVGKRLADELPRAQLDAYRSGLRSVRQRAIKRATGEYAQTPAPTEEPMTPEQPAPAAPKPETKVCGRSDCVHGGTPQPLSEFDNCKKTKDGKAHYCKECRRRMQNESRARIKEQKEAQKKKAIASQAQREIQRQAPAPPPAAKSKTAHPVSRYVDVAAGIGSLIERKQAAYGDSFGKSGDILRVLYPDGVRPEQYADMLCVVRIIDKLFRVATEKDALGESPFADIAGYGILGVIKDMAAKEAKK